MEIIATFTSSVYFNYLLFILVEYMALKLACMHIVLLNFVKKMFWVENIYREINCISLDAEFYHFLWILPLPRPKPLLGQG